MYLNFKLQEIQIEAFLLVLLLLVTLILGWQILLDVLLNYSYSLRLKNKKKAKKVNKEVLDYCFNRLEISMELIRSVETKLKYAINGGR